MNLQFASRRDSVSAMFDPDRFFRNSLADLKADGWYQTFLELERRAGAFPLTDCPGRSDPVVVWCSNDYLGMGQHPVVLAAMHEAVDRVGTGVGGTRNISGNTRDHVLLERELADLHGKEAALVFATGYVTNEAAVSTFAGLIPECIVYSDALHQEGVAYVKSRLREAGLPVMPSETPLVPVLVGDAHLVRHISDGLLAQHGIYIQPINYLTVPRGTERLRITPTPLHTHEQVDHLVGALTAVFRAHGIGAGQA